MLPSIRPLLRFIDLEETFEKHGFQKKVRNEWIDVRLSIWNTHFNESLSLELPSSSPQSARDVSPRDFSLESRVYVY